MEDWSKLNSDQQKLVAENEIPQAILDQRKDSQLSPEEIRGLRDSIVTLSGDLESLKTEKTGIYTDLKAARKIIKDLNEKVTSLEAGGGSLGDDSDFPNVGKVKALIADVTKVSNEKVDGIRNDMARERESTDDRRMKGRTDLPIPYVDAIKIFAGLAKLNPEFYEQVRRESARPGGRPAELAYKIALREHPEFVQKVKELGADEVITNLSNAGKIKKLPAGGAGSGAKDANEMSFEEIMALSDDEWNKLAKGEGK